jgi:hypothetical protein
MKLNNSDIPEGVFMRTLCSLFGLLLLFLVGCGTARETGQIPSSREVLTAQEISRSGALTAYDAIRTLRPAFLRAEGPKAVLPYPRSTIYPIYTVVYLNGMYTGELDSLKDMTAQNIDEIRYIEANDATLMYGTGHSAGVIMVTTKLN